MSRLTTLPEVGQYARWREPICVRVSGIDARYAAVVGEQVGQAAAVAGARLGRAGCKPNLMIAFAGDAAQLARTLRNGSSVNLLKLTRSADREAFVAGDAPVRWLYTLRKSDSADVGAGEGDAPAPAGAGAPAGMENEDAGGFGTRRFTSSLIDSNLIVGIRGAVVIVDIKRAEGFPLESVAAYVARVALAQTPLPPPAVAAPTILSLFSRGPEAKTAAAGLTQWDEAYLKALYRAAPNRERFSQRARIQSQMTAILLEGDRRPDTP